MAQVVFDAEFMSLADKIKAIEHRAPDKILNRMDKEGNALRRELRDATPEGPTGNLKKGWKTERANNEYGTYVKKINSEAPHYHLVERGHRLTDHTGTKQIGVVKGKFFAKKVLDDYEPGMNARYESMIDEIMGDVFG